MATEKTRTGYHVLRQTNADGATPTFQIVGHDLTAHSAEQAIRIYAEKAGDEAPGTYVAVPSSRWKLTPISVETKTIVRLGTAT